MCDCIVMSCKSGHEGPKFKENTYMYKVRMHIFSSLSVMRYIFIGIDLCNGRYDNQKHSLFHTLNNVNSKDFHQANFNGASLEFGGPREPWHDIHSRLEGPIAWDVLFNFDQRWRKQAGERREKLLVPIQELGLIQTPITAEDDPETWNVQLFRSIDAGG
jgi:phospholipase D1/2